MAYKKPEYKFPKAPQNLDENKSRGQVNLALENNIIKTLRTRIKEAGLVEKVVDGVMEEAENNNYKNAIKLLEIVKEPESTTTVNINQAVQVNKKDIDEAVNIINELR